MAKKSFKIKGMDCDACAKMIELDLEDIGAKADCSYSKCTLDVEFDSDTLSEEDIRKKVIESGYDLDI